MTLNVGLSVPFLTSVVDGHLGPNLHLGILKPCSEQQRFSSSTSEVFPPKATHLASPHPTLCACLPFFSTQHGPLSVSLSGSLFMLQVSCLGSAFVLRPVGLRIHSRASYAAFIPAQADSRSP